MQSSVFEIVLGPFFVAGIPTEIPPEQVASVGAAMEFATPGGACRIPLFRKRCSYAPDRCEFDDLVIHQNDLPCEVQYRLFYAAETRIGTFVPLNAVLVSMFQQFKINRTAADILNDLSATVALEFHHARKPALLCDFLQDEGFGLSWIQFYGRRVNTVICWCPPNERGKTSEGGILVSWMDFRPKPDGTLGNGVWVEPFKDSISHALHREFHSRFKHRPLEILSDQGKKALLAEFQWTPLARMTSKQAREARITFIREHKVLAGNPKELAEAMRSAGLYAESTTSHQIMKFLPSLISQSGV